MKFNHESIEKSIWLLGFLTVFAVIWGGLVQIVPLLGDKNLRPEEAKTFNKPYDPLRLAGFNIYVREGCYNCHSQMIRPFRWETERYGHYSLAEESQYDRPFQWGSRRIGPDLARVGGRYSDEWHKLHLINPRSRVPSSNMPSFPWLGKKAANISLTEKSILTKIKLGEPYTASNFPEAAKTTKGTNTLSKEEISAWVKKELEGKTELDAMVAYLQGLGRAFAENR